MPLKILDPDLPLRRDAANEGASDIAYNKMHSESLGLDSRDLSDPQAGKGFIMHNVREFIQEMTRGLFNWSQKASIWPLTFGIKCCAIEMMAFGAARYDSDRMGVFFRASPRQADLMIVAGPATIKLKDVILRLYEQMPEPKYVIAFGECAICGGPFWDSYSVINGVDKLIPVDVYVPGCPPRPEQLLLAIQKLQEIIDDRSKNHGKTPRKTHVIDAIDMPHESREELLAEVLAHPTLNIGHQSGSPRYQPTPEQLLHATPTGQPAELQNHVAAPASTPSSPPAISSLSSVSSPSNAPAAQTTNTARMANTAQTTKAAQTTNVVQTAKQETPAQKAGDDA